MTALIFATKTVEYTRKKAYVEISPADAGQQRSSWDVQILIPPLTKKQSDTLSQAILPQHLNASTPKTVHFTGLSISLGTEVTTNT